MADFAPRQNLNFDRAILEHTIAMTGLLGSPRARKPISVPAAISPRQDGTPVGRLAPANPAGVPLIRGEG